MAASIPAGDIIAQSPLSRTSTLYGSLVQVLVSAGAGSTTLTVPDVVGDTRESAESKVKAQALVPKVRNVPSETVAKGRVISQMPPAGRKAASGAEVGLFVSSGPVAAVTVPTLVGTPSADAADAITKVGLTPVVVSIALDEGVPGTVYAQYPEAGAVSQPGWPVVILVPEAQGASQ